MTLRTRLVLTVAALNAAGLIVIVGAVLGTIQDWLAGAETDPGALAGRVLGITIGVPVLVLIGTTALGAVIMRSLTRPLETMCRTATAIGDGDLARRVPAYDERTEAGRLGSALNSMLGTIESEIGRRRESEDRLRRFLADASHELRTPVATIRGYAELFRRGAARHPEDLATSMARIESEAARMGALVDEMMLLARLDEGRPLESEPVDLADLAADAVADARAVERGRLIGLDVQGPVPVKGDEKRLRQVLGNLLTNLREHTPETAAALVAVSTHDDAAIVTVSDEGPGFADGDRVFDRFFRGTSAAPGRGSGLGLAVVAAVVKAHDGTVVVTSEPGRGASFRITIPAFHRVL